MRRKALRNQEYGLACTKEDFDFDLGPTFNAGEFYEIVMSNPDGLQLKDHLTGMTEYFTHRDIALVIR